ncbi:MULTISPECIES: PIG-L deacetylase family protein [Corynebacterium]|nr:MULTISPECIES: PIG-L deacetylase family protein [Corynebacterium]
MERLTLSENDRVLAVVAHPDDMEYGASAAVAKWAEDGVEVAYLLLTHGEHGIAGGDPQQVRETRSQEQRRACDIVGAGELEMLDFTDGLLEHTLELRQAIAAKIREFRPTVVLTQDWSVIVPWGVNQADHRVAGLAAVDAARDAGNEFLYPEAGPRHQTNTLLVHGAASPNVAVEVEQRHVDKGAASLDAHEAYFAALPDHPSGDEIVGQAAKDGGEALGVPLAIVFASFPL